MQNQYENEETSSTMDSFLCPSFSTYSSNNINDVVQQVTNENDNSHSQNDNDDFEFVAFHNHRRNLTHDAFPIFNRDGDERRNSDAAEISNSLKILLIGNEKEERNRVPSTEVEDDLDLIPAESYCLWTPNSSPIASLPASPMNSPIKFKKSNSNGSPKLPIASPMNSLCKCKKSNSTGSSSSSSSSSRWKFLSLLRRSKSDGKESLNLLIPAKKENLKVISGGNGSGEKNVAGKKIPATEKKTPATVSAMEVFYRRKKEMRVKSYLPYKKELIGFSVGFNANIGRGFPLHV